MSKTDYSELEKIWSEVIKRKSYCNHANSETTQDENGVYHFHCNDCGLIGMGDYTAALKLGWLL